MHRSVKRVAGVLGTASAFSALTLAATPVAAQADVLSLNACDNSALSQPFTQWLDPNSYKLAPGGDFEGGPGWSLRGGAGVASGSESFAVTGSAGTSSLSLSAGSSATSPQTCVNAAYPSFRLFARSEDPGATVAVSVVYNTALGTVTLPVGTLTPSSDWQPTLPMLTGSAVAGLLSGGTANVSLRFVASGGTTQIDDVYVDPHSRCC
ncbi:MAG: hypothetical protein QOD66_2692 [Solirubrobacteraceae bacterium]|nr:hypothetical protein [Solirubrobacteraceae bacterium]